MLGMQPCHSTLHRARPCLSRSTHLVGTAPLQKGVVHTVAQHVSTCRRQMRRLALARAAKREVEEDDEMPLQSATAPKPAVPAEDELEASVSRTADSAGLDGADSPASTSGALGLLSNPAVVTSPYPIPVLFFAPCSGLCASILLKAAGSTGPPASTRSMLGLLGRKVVVASLHVIVSYASLFRSL